MNIYFTVRQLSGMGGLLLINSMSHDNKLILPPSVIHPVACSTSCPTCGDLYTYVCNVYCTGVMYLNSRVFIYAINVKK